jgi:hypothetical protein
MRRLAPLLVAATLLVAPRASADEDAEERARVLFTEGRDAMDRNDYATACEKFGESLRLFRRASMLLNLGACNEKLGRLGTALAYWREGLSALQITDRERVQKAKEEIAALERRAPRVLLTLPRDLPAQSIVAVDGAALAAARWSEPIYLDPGDHALTLDVPGRKQRRVTVSVVEGQEVPITLERGAAIAPDVITVTEPNTAQLVVGWTLGGLGVAGLVVGAVTGGLVLDRKSVVEEHCNDDDICADDTGVEAAEEGRTLAIVSTVGFVAGAALVTAGIILLVTADTGDEDLHVALSPSGVSLRGRF